MINATIGNELLKAAETFSAAIIKSLEDAKKLGYPLNWKMARKTDDKDLYPQRAFGDTALVILEDYKNTVSSSLKSLATNDWRPLWEISGMYKGLSKQMDFDFEWMTPENKEATFTAMDNLIGIACEISRLGHEQQNRA
jgi:hypothetical protein